MNNTLTTTRTARILFFCIVVSPNLSGQARGTHLECKLAKVTLAIGYAEIVSAGGNCPFPRQFSIQDKPLVFLTMAGRHKSCKQMG
jgi:hypothetical protein